MKIEEKLIEAPLIEELKKRGWKWIEDKNLPRISFDKPLLVENLKEKIREINKNKNLTNEDVDNVVRILENLPSDQNGHREVLRFLKYGIDINTKKEGIKRVEIFDYKDIENNEFLVTNQFRFTGRENIRLDVVLFVNGIPLVNIECKNPYTLKTNYFEAYHQIKRYEKTAPELYKYIQIGIGYAEMVKYFPIVPWEEKVDQYIWRWDDLNEEEAIFEFLRPEMVLDIIRNFLFIKQIRGTEIRKIIGRYMQVRAANKIYQRVIDNLLGKDNKNKGLIWHWQGSGKTLTMIFSAHKLYFEPLLKNPTIFFIVDRRDLERQFGENELGQLDLNFSYEVLDSIRKLKEVLTHDNYQGKRGVFLTLIHKFNLAEEEILNELIGENKIGERKNVVCFLDEVHRSQYGLLANKMKSILKNAFFFGFTGTPIVEREKNTYLEFGYPLDKEPYLDRYFIEDAIRDGYVLNIVYLPRKEKDINLNKEDLEWFIKEMDIEDINDEMDLNSLEKIILDEELKRRIRTRIDHINVILENEKRIEKICQDIVNHFKTNLDGKFKGLIVTGSRRACVRYKKIIDQFLSPEETEVVMSFKADEPKEEIKNYEESLKKRYNINDTEEITKKIINKFRNQENPKLLIVTDMLITGFDEPKLQVIYLDKLLKKHRLLQAMARTNRPFGEIKKAGLVVDYVGIFDYWLDALRFYSQEDRYGIEKEIWDVSKIKASFEETIEKLKSLFGDRFGIFEKKNIDEVIAELSQNEEKAEEFVKLFKDLRASYQFLNIVEEKIDEKIRYLKEYRWLACIYEGYKKLIKPQIDEREFDKYFDKTLKLIHESMEIKEIIDLSQPFIITLEHLKKLRESKLTEIEKTIGILEGLKTMVSIYENKNPIYKTISEKVKKLVEDWKNRRIDYKTLYEEEIKIFEYLKEKEEEKEKSGLKDIEFGFKILLEKDERLVNIATQLAKEIYQGIESLLIDNWQENNAIVAEVKKNIRKILRKIKKEYQMGLEEFDNMVKNLSDFLINYVK